jgi:hypothetical protein
MANEDSIIEALKKLIPAETIDGADVRNIADLVDLDIAHRLLLVENSIGQDEVELFLSAYVPPVVEATKRDDGRYETRWQTEDGPDFKIISADEAKIMRSRFLLLKGFYGRNWNKLTLPKQNEVAAKYDIHFIPNILLSED